MKRILGGIIVCLVISISIAWFEGLEGSTATIGRAFEDPALRKSLTESTLGYLLIPYSLYSETGTFVPFVAWIGGGFVAGLITKNSRKGILVGMVSMGIAWMTLSYFSGLFANLSFKESITALTAHAKGMEKDLISVAFSVAIPACIGGEITSDEKRGVIQLKRKEESPDI